MATSFKFTNPPPPACCATLVCLAVGILGLAQGLQAAPSQKTPAASPPAVTNAPVAEEVIPQSEFNDKLPQGKDPFFPRSTRRDAVASSVVARTAIDSSSLLLKGISGTASQRLAIINDRTFGAGEDGEVNTATGKIRIRCEEIRDKSVVIEFGNPPQRQELRLPQGF